MGAVPKYGYGGPPETAPLPTGLRSAEVRDVDPSALLPSPRAPTTMAPRGTTAKQKGPSMFTAGKDPDLYRTLRLEGHSRLEAGRQAGYAWKNEGTAQVCGCKLERKLGLTIPRQGRGPGKRGERPKADRAAALTKSPGTYVAGDTTSLDACIAEFEGRIESLTEAIAALRKVREFF